MTFKTIPITLLTILIILAGYYGYKKLTLPKASSIPTTPSIVDMTKNPKIVNEVDDYKLPEGEQIYNLSHGVDIVGPRASKISYNPLSVVPGTKQTITVTFPESEQVSSAVIFITTDDVEEQKLVLEQIKNTSTWSGTWTVTDTINNRYSARLFFVGPSGTYNITSHIL